MCLKIFDGEVVTDDWMYCVKGKLDDDAGTPRPVVEAYRLPMIKRGCVDLSAKPEDLRGLHLSEVPMVVSKMFLDCKNGQAFV